jgi:predicted nucleic acid-binding protein
VIAVSDASPLNYLIVLGYSSVLADIFEHVLIPEAVLHELQHPDAPQPVRSWFRSMPSWLSVRREPFPSSLDLPANLHAGETAAIQLAHHGGFQVVLLDDRDARCAAECMGLVAVGTLRLLAEASHAGLLSLSHAFERLKRTNFRASERLYAALLEESGK